jgi:hypothetical protein
MCEKAQLILLFSAEKGMFDVKAVVEAVCTVIPSSRNLVIGRPATSSAPTMGMRKGQREGRLLGEHRVGVGARSTEGLRGNA